MDDKLQFKSPIKKSFMLFMILKTFGKQALFTVTVGNAVPEENRVIFLPNKTLKHINTHRPLELLIYIKGTL